jgi:phytoene dehydrogenase-like protein
MRATFQARCPSWSEEVYFAMTASPRTFERFTARPDGLVGGIPKKKGWQNYLALGPRTLRKDFYLVGDSNFPGQSTLATATGGQRVAYALGKQIKRTSNELLLPSAKVKSEV